MRQTFGALAIAIIATGAQSQTLEQVLDQLTANRAEEARADAERAAQYAQEYRSALLIACRDKLETDSFAALTNDRCAELFLRHGLVKQER